MAEQWEPRKDELPTFTGDVPADAVLTERVLWHRFLVFLQRRFSGYAVACAVACVVFALAALVTPVPDWAKGEPVSVPTEIVLAVVAVAAAAACLVRVIPGVARFVLGAVPGGCGVMAAGVANAAWGVYPWATPVGIAGLAAMLGYVVLAGMRVRHWSSRRLDRLLAGRDTREAA